MSTDPLLHFAAGGISASISAAVTCPLEVVKTRFQSSLYANSRTAASTHNPIAGVLHALRSIYVNEGLASLWKGLGPNLVGVAPARAIHFMVYTKSKEKMIAHFETETSWIHMTAAATAGLCTAMATNPIWLIKTRMQLQSQAVDNTIKYKNSFQCLVHVLKTEGIRGLYKGLSASILGLSEGTLQFVMYEKLKKELKQVRGHDEVQWVDTFIAASIAKLVAAGITYPHEVLRTRLRQSPMKDGSHIYTSLGQATKLIYKQEGIRAFYGGMAAHLMRVVPNAAIMFFCYEFIVKTFS